MARHPLRRLVALVGLVLMAASCSGSGDGAADPTSTAPPSTTTVAPSSTLPPATTTTTAAGDSEATTTTEPGVDPEVETQLQAAIGELVAVAEELRGLEFIEAPAVTVVTPDELARRVAELIEEDLDPDDLAVDERFLQMMGMLDVGTDYAGLVVALYEEQVAGFYDGETRELVVGGDSAELTPLAKTVVLHELVHALADQHFGFHGEFTRLLDEERYDEALALQALIEGDAIFHQLDYVQTLSPAELLQLLEEQTTADLDVFASSPGFLQDSLMFPYEEGFSLVAELVSAGGVDAVNRAYENPPQITEAVLHPDRYFGQEAPRLVEPVGIELPGFEVYESGTYGEWATKLLLRDGVPRGEASQAADGWGGDSYTILFDEDDVVFAWEYLGDSERDAIELVEALVEVAEGRMAAGEAVAEAGGVLYASEDLYLFIDRVDDRMYYVATTDPELGPAIRRQLIG
jgi:hypothetical protein